MFSYVVYKGVHLLGIMMLFLSLGGLILYSLNGGKKEKNLYRIPAALTHGFGMFLTLLGGFGMMARLGIAHTSWPTWIFAKLLIWLAFGLSIAWIYRKPAQAKVQWWGLLCLGLFAIVTVSLKF